MKESLKFLGVPAIKREGYIEGQGGYDSVGRPLNVEIAIAAFNSFKEDGYITSETKEISVNNLINKASKEIRKVIDNYRE